MLGIVVIWILSAFLFNGRRDDLEQLILYPENFPKQLNVSSMFWVVPNLKNTINFHLHKEILYAGYH